MALYRFNVVGTGRSALLFAPVTIALLYLVWFCWAGFTYRFTASGFEVRVPLFRLNSVRIGEIKSYNVCPISAGQWGGVGLRTRGKSRAYYWGGTLAVRVTLADRELWLGAKDPDEVLALMRQIAPGQHTPVCQ